ncbi:MAG: D-Ala-D-Ala carboxypeptidase family metallohydrolase [Thermodesulfobacteriota bacterium]
MSERLSENFRRAEFACRCGCGAAEVDPALVSRLQDLRRRLGRPLVVTSGVRCAAHNAAVGGAQASEHLTGQGVDVRAVSPREKYEVVAEAMAAGFLRIGVGREFIHLGVSPSHPGTVLWLY